MTKTASLSRHLWTWLYTWFILVSKYFMRNLDWTNSCSSSTTLIFLKLNPCENTPKCPSHNTELYFFSIFLFPHSDNESLLASRGISSQGSGLPRGLSGSESGLVHREFLLSQLYYCGVMTLRNLEENYNYHLVIVGPSGASRVAAYIHRRHVHWDRGGTCPPGLCPCHTWSSLSAASAWMSPQQSDRL